MSKIKLSKKQWKELLSNRKYSPFMYASIEYIKESDCVEIRYYPTLAHKLLSVALFIPMLLWEGFKNIEEVLGWVINTWSNQQCMSDHVGRIMTEDRKGSENVERIREFIIEKGLVD